MRAEDWAAAVAGILDRGDARARDVGQWRACEALARDLQTYVPAHPVDASGQTLDPAYDVRRLAQFATRDDVERELRIAGPDAARGLAEWRVAVTTAEGLSARRLLTLGRSVAWCVGMLARRPKDPTKISAMADAIGQWTHKVWGVDAPLEGDLRDWSIRATRRYDLLAKAPRTIGLSRVE